MKSLSDIVKFTKMKSLRESDDKSMVKSREGVLRCEGRRKCTDAEDHLENFTRKGRSLAEEAAWLGKWGWEGGGGEG